MFFFRQQGEWGRKRPQKGDEKITVALYKNRGAKEAAG